ncbi:hypothetical protein VN97_g6882 [Penicillium thymicola]|uniref:Uncharacterized protein n=1 Tax=Penicillium thymicola TaxID=293382 RepID=A0AAI9X775_PENTH|nr:hypothetical protein VN97_g6882 [Penicillium thymicola]
MKLFPPYKISYTPGPSDESCRSLYEAEAATVFIRICLGEDGKSGHKSTSPPLVVIRTTLRYSVSPQEALLSISLIQSHKAAGLFTGAIAQSCGNGYATSPSAAAAPILPFVNKLCPHVAGATSIIDGVYLGDMPIAQLEKGRKCINNVKFVAGYMSDEYQSLVAEALPPSITNLEPGLEIMQKTGTLNIKKQS